MDLSAMTDAELDALQLAVNVEIANRLQKSRMLRRMAGVMEDAQAAGVPDEEIATSFAEAKTQAKIKYTPPVVDTTTTIADKTLTTPRPARTASGFRANTIDV